jgi:hypothetical protein
VRGKKDLREKEAMSYGQAGDERLQYRKLLVGCLEKSPDLGTYFFVVSSKGNLLNFSQLQKKVGREEMSAIAYTLLFL